jgi:hypothetical protein
MLLVTSSLFLVNGEAYPSQEHVLSQDEVSSLTRVYGTDFSGNIFRTVSEQQFQDYIIKLTENGSRPQSTPNNVYARN